MLEPNQIPNLIKLLDDEDLTVQNSVIHELLSFGSLLKEEYKKIPFSLNAKQAQCLQFVFRCEKHRDLKRRWTAWPYIKDEALRLEKALTIISQFLSVGDEDTQLSDALDRLAVMYCERFKQPTARRLANFLFKEQGLKGNDYDYYNPQNSNLSYVIKNKKGVPVSLTAIYMLVGHRLGLSIEGCNFPGHFLARVNKADGREFVDCFSSGQIIKERDILRVSHQHDKDITHILSEKSDVETMIGRVLANLIRAYQMQDDEDGAQVMIELFKELEQAQERRVLYELSPEELVVEVKPQFYLGELVRHKRYGYRGIIVDYDLECQATDDWYYGNQTQPDRMQPWFHVLVDGSDEVTYVAESNLILDDNKNKIEHPLLTYFFNTSEDGRYIRNNNPWPDSIF